MTSESAKATLAGTTDENASVPEPDEMIGVPLELVLVTTLRSLGLHEDRANEILQKWGNLTPDALDHFGDFGTFARKALQTAVESEDCHTDDEDVDWSDHLRRIGTNEKLVKAIAGSGDEHDQIRLMRSAAGWADQATEHRWDHLLYFHKASNTRARGGIELPKNTGNTGETQGEFEQEPTSWGARTSQWRR